MPKKDFKDSPALNFITSEEKDIDQEVSSAYDKSKQEFDIMNPSKQTGQKLPKLNVAFYNDHYAYVQKISGVMGMSATAYINKLIADDKEKNIELYIKIKNLSAQI